MSVPARAYLSIGEVLSRLRTEFSDITISKIRFLESEGLIEPQRTPGLGLDLSEKIFWIDLVQELLKPFNLILCLIRDLNSSIYQQLLTGQNRSPYPKS